MDNDTADVDIRHLRKVCGDGDGNLGDGQDGLELQRRRAVDGVGPNLWAALCLSRAVMPRQHHGRCRRQTTQGGHAPFLFSSFGFTNPRGEGEGEDRAKLVYERGGRDTSLARNTGTLPRGRE